MTSSSARLVRVGIIGCGRIARVHLRYLRQVPGVEVVGFCDRDLQQADELRRHAGAGEVFREVADLLRTPLDAVHVLTPPTAHADVAIAALESGTHVLVEKPMATTAAAARRMEAAAHAAGRILCVDHNRLFDPVVAQARALIADGAIGSLLSVEVYQGVNVQEGGPAAAPLLMWLNLAPHPLYLLRAFVGDIAEWHAYGGPLGELRAVLKGTRALGYLCFSPGTMPYLNALALHGTKGTIHIDMNTMMLLRRRERRLPKMLAKAALNVESGLQLLWGTARTTVRVASGRLGTYPGMGVVIRGFYDAVRTDADPPVSTADGRVVVELLERVWTEAQDGDPGVQEGRRRWGAGWLPTRGEAKALVSGAAGLRGRQTVLVTGAAGFLGRHVVAALRQQGHRVRAMVHSSPPPSDWHGVEVVTAALSDNRGIARACADVHAVVHCAARVARRGSRAEFVRDNVSGTVHLLEAARAAGVASFVHVSSIAVYGHVSQSPPIVEDGGYDPYPELRGAYTWSKIEADRLVQQFGWAGGVRTVILRPGILIGADGPEFTARLSIGPIKGRLLIVGRRDALLPLCHVDDVARAIIAALTAERAQGPYNIVDNAVTQEEWLQGRVARGLSARVHYVSPSLLAIPAAVLEFVARVFRRSSPTLSRYKIRRATESLLYDAGRARRDIGWTPEVGLRAFLDTSQTHAGVLTQHDDVPGQVAVARGRESIR
jgi:nucleoside-diphosphate-sugar epimerase/predicted dehydrogenase